MKRSDQEIKDRDQLDAIIKRNRVCRLGVCDDGKPYVVPMCYGYDGASLYMHGSPKGKKMDILQKNKHVCFEFDEIGATQQAEQACAWGIDYKSIIGLGTAEFLDDIEEKRKALNCIMQQYTDQPFEFPEPAIKGTCVIKIHIDSMTGKKSD